MELHEGMILSYSETLRSETSHGIYRRERERYVAGLNLEFMEWDGMTG